MKEWLKWHRHKPLPGQFAAAVRDYLPSGGRRKDNGTCIHRASGKYRRPRARPSGRLGGRGGTLPSTARLDRAQVRRHSERFTAQRGLAGRRHAAGTGRQPCVRGHPAGRGHRIHQSRRRREFAVQLYSPTARRRPVESLLLMGA